MNILTICNTSDKVVCDLLTMGARDLKFGQNTGYLAYVLMAKSNLIKTYKMNILTICNISDKVVCNFLTKGARDPIWSEYWISSLCSDGLIKFQ